MDLIDNEYAICQNCKHNLNSICTLYKVKIEKDEWCSKWTENETQEGDQNGTES